MLARNLEQGVEILATIVVGIAFPMVLLLLGAMLGGAGHGSLFLYFLVGSPASVFTNFEDAFLCAFFFWFAIALLLLLRRRKWARQTTFALMIAHYAAIPVLVFKTDPGTLFKTVQALWPFVLAYIAIYLPVQFIIWNWLKKAKSSVPCSVP